MTAIANAANPVAHQPAQVATPRTTFDGWEQYPEKLLCFDPFSCNAVKLRKRLQAESKSLFDDKKTDVHVLDIDFEPNSQILSRSFSEATEVETRLSAALPAFRILSLLRKNSLERLQISQELLLKFLQSHNIGPCFIDLLFAFRNVEELSDIGQSFWSPLQPHENQYELCYQLKYVERNEYVQGIKWSEREVGVYHKFSVKGHDNAVMVLLNANPISEAYHRMQEILSTKKAAQVAFGRPLSLHVMVVSSYLDNWRWFMNEHGRKWRATEDRFFSVELRPGALSFEELQMLRNDESRLLAASTILKATTKTIDRLLMVARSMTSLQPGATESLVRDDLACCESADAQSLKALRLKSEGYSASIQVLQGRVGRLIKLLADGLDQQSQKATTNIADSTFKLTKQSVEDNAIVKVITVITVIYLPTQGVATLFGMNFTSLPDASGNIKFAKDWWIFLATAIPLTVVTCGVLLIAMLVERQKKKKSNRLVGS